MAGHDADGCEFCRTMKLDHETVLRQMAEVNETLAVLRALSDFEVLAHALVIEAERMDEGQPMQWVIPVSLAEQLGIAPATGDGA